MDFEILRKTAKIIAGVKEFFLYLHPHFRIMAQLVQSIPAKTGRVTGKRNKGSLAQLVQSIPAKTGRVTGKRNKREFSSVGSEHPG